MRIAIVDDKNTWRECAKKCVSHIRLNSKKEIFAFESGKNLLEYPMIFDVVIADIEMPEMDGFETIVKYKEINPKVIPIIITTHTEMSRKGYLVNAFRYIDKTHMEQEMEEALISAEKVLKKNKIIAVNVVNEGETKLVLGEILYFETEKHNVRIHLEDKDYICTNKMADLEEIVKNEGFFRCHKSYIVNLDKIESFDKIFVKLSDDSKIYVSARKYGELNKKYLERKYNFANA